MDAAARGEDEGAQRITLPLRLTISRHRQSCASAIFSLPFSSILLASRPSKALSTAASLILVSLPYVILVILLYAIPVSLPHAILASAESSHTNMPPKGEPTAKGKRLAEASSSTPDKVAQAAAPSAVKSQEAAEQAEEDATATTMATW